jgi:hypothetical protein
MTLTATLLNKKNKKEVFNLLDTVISLMSQELPLHSQDF